MDDLTTYLEKIDRSLRQILEEELMRKEPSREKISVLLSARNYICLAIDIIEDYMEDK